MADKKSFYDPIKTTKNALDVHLRHLQNWSKEIPVVGSSTNNTVNNYTQLSLKYNDATIKDVDILNLKKNLIILGAPGSGKTTLLKMLINQIINKNSEVVGLPVLIKVREIPREGSLWSEMSSIFSFTETKENEKSLLDFINKHKLYILIDGLDEIQFSERDKLIKDLKYLYEHTFDGMIISTARTSSFEYSFNAQILEILPFSKEQSYQFIQRFLGKENKFTQELENSLFTELAKSPITLTILLSYFSRYNRLPSTPSDLYEKVISTYLEEWDSMRGINRQSRFQALSVNRKHSLLMRLAYELTLEKKHAFSIREFGNIMDRIKVSFDLKVFDTNLLLQELESTSGLISRDNYDLYSFTHLSIQEYLAAEHVIRFPFIDMEMMANYPEVLSIAVKLSSNEPEYLEYLLKQLDTKLISTQIFQRFISRLIIESIDFENSIVRKVLLTYIESSELSKDDKNFIKDYITTYNNVYKK